VALLRLQSFPTLVVWTVVWLSSEILVVRFIKQNLWCPVIFTHLHRLNHSMEGENVVRPFHECILTITPGQRGGWAWTAIHDWPTPLAPRIRSVGHLAY